MEKLRLSKAIQILKKTNRPSILKTRFIYTGGYEQGSNTYGHKNSYLIFYYDLYIYYYSLYFVISSAILNDISSSATTHSFLHGISSCAFLGVSRTLCEGENTECRGLILKQTLS